MHIYICIFVLLSNIVCTACSVLHIRCVLYVLYYILGGSGFLIRGRLVGRELLAGGEARSFFDFEAQVSYIR